MKMIMRIFRQPKNKKKKNSTPKLNINEIKQNFEKLDENDNENIS